MKSGIVFLLGSFLLTFAMALPAEIRITTAHHPPGQGSAQFRFSNVPPPSKNDAASKATFTLLQGERDPNGGSLEKLHDGRIPQSEDQPADNFFFNAGTDGGRILVDLGEAIEIRQVNTYSWHPNTRGPQVYKLYAGDDSAEKFQARPEKGAPPEAHGWKLVARVDTRPKEGRGGGQYGVSISNTDGIIGRHRFLLFEISSTHATNRFGNTFYSEIDVIDANAPQIEESPEMAPTTPVLTVVETGEGKFHLTIDTTAAPDLTEWAREQLVPVVREWYPKIVSLLPGDGFEAPARVTILFREGMGGTPASAGGSRINCNIDWFRRNLKGEARGAVVHELVHIVQQYGLARRNPNATRTPGWLVEGIADYVRWFLYEPEPRGAEITSRNIGRARYDASYRVTGNFLNWVTEHYDKRIVEKLNAAAREGKYHEDLWRDLTGKTVQELGVEWKEIHEKRLAAISPQPPQSSNSE
jgi:hypothetical protein